MATYCICALIRLFQKTRTKKRSQLFQKTRTKKRSRLFHFIKINFYKGNNTLKRFHLIFIRYRNDCNN